jgi:dCMP deaminase|tara:strand:+ start:284 stop:697 length:414 start_codon:yes stop_codon:yes gene_type:complete
MPENRPGWDDIWMDMAVSISRRSYDPKWKVGAIVVTGDNTSVLSVGYNGNYTGGPNSIESMSPGQSGMIHAEINALLKMDYHNHKRKVMYVTLSPCRMCAKAIVNSGIDEVVYLEEYRDRGGLEILEQCKIKTRKLD